MNDESAIKFLKEEKEVKALRDFENSYYGQVLEGRVNND